MAGFSALTGLLSGTKPCSTREQTNQKPIQIFMCVCQHCISTPPPPRPRPAGFSVKKVCLVTEELVLQMERKNVFGSNCSLVFLLIYLTAKYDSFPLWFRSALQVWNLLPFAVLSQCQERTAAGEKKKFFMHFKFLKSFSLYIVKNFYTESTFQSQA